MQNIPTLVQGDHNLGSLRDILFVPVSMVDEIKPPVDGELEFDALQFQTEAAILFKLEFTADTAQYAYEEVKSGNGTSFKVKITASVPKDYLFRPGDFTEMQNQKFFVITRDNNAKSRLHGHINLQGEKYGMTFSADFDSGKARANFNGYKLEFSMESPFRPSVMEEISEIPVDPGFPYDPGDEAGPVDPGTG